VHDLETRADLAGDIAEIALLKETNAALWNRVQELEDEIKRMAGCAQQPRASRPNSSGSTTPKSMSG
jgi:hypothetical protein